MPGKTPRSNGKEPVENDIRNNQDVDMKDAGKGKGKKAAKDGDDEMTVVVPPSKASKQSSAPPPGDADGDVSMGDEETTDGEPKVDPVAQTVAGKQTRSPRASSQVLAADCSRHREQLCSTRSCRGPL